jgi:hypothetical protein
MPKFSAYIFPALLLDLGLGAGLRFAMQVRSVTTNLMFLLAAAWFTGIQGI